MHGNLLVIGNYADKTIQKLLPKDADGAMMGGTALRLGCLQLRPGGNGVTALQNAEAQDAPAIILEFLRQAKPRVQNGVDSALKRDIANVDDLVDLVRPAYVIAKGELHQPSPKDTVAGWFNRIEAFLIAAKDDDTIAVYDVHS